MTVVVPNALALATIADGSAIVASDHRNNYAATQVGVNGLIAMFTNAPTKGDLIVSAGAGSFDRLGVGANGQAIIADSTQALGMKWASAGATTLRKTTAKTVNTTVAATDLLNAEITLAALAANSAVRLTAWGDYLPNSGGATAAPRLQLLLGGTTLLDTSAGTAATQSASATRGGWRLVAEIFNLGATNSQVAYLTFSCVTPGSGSAMSTAFTTGEGLYANCYNGSVFYGLLAQGVNTAAVDTSAAKALVLNVINASASATYEMKLFGALVEVI